MSYVGRKSGRAALISADIPSNLNLLGDYVKIPSATTTERDALTPAVGMMLYNSTLGIMQQYSASGWASIDSPPTVSSLNYPGDDTALDVVGEYNDATCDYNNDPTIAHDANSNMKVGMSVSGTGIPAGATIASVTSTTAFELSASTTGGAVTNGTLTFNTQTLIITGTNFSVGATVAIDGTAPSIVTRDSSSQITVTGTPAKTAGTKVDGLVVSNTSGLAASINVDYSPLPGWTTASGNVLSTFEGTSGIDVDLAATGTAPITYAITTGALPGGLAMSTSTGDITGTISSATSTFNFTVTATDAEAQSSPRLFNIINNGTAPTGGTITDISGYRVHTFLSSGPLEFFASINIEYLIIGGGGGGGGDIGGGGGGGAFRTNVSGATNGGGASLGSTYGATAQVYTITVGDGGDLGIGNDVAATVGDPGGNSSIVPVSGTSIISNGGGGGAGEGSGRMDGNANGNASAGGAAHNGGTSAAGGTYGYAGGTGSSSNGSGGGGAAAAAVAGSTNRHGGAGLLSTIDGNSYYYAGGGGGGKHDAGDAGDGGIGGGGGCGKSTSYGGSAGTGGASARNAGGDGTTNDQGGTGGAGGTNTGGGGGSTGEGNNGGGDGGSGIVIIRYAI